MITTDVVIGPAAWASYLVNGDASGLTVEEVRHADHWMVQNEVRNVVDVSEPWFSNHYDLHDTLSEFSGGEVADYTVDRTEL